MSLSRQLLPAAAIVAALLVASPLLGSAPRVSTVIFVDDDAALGGDGSSWGTAYKFLQDALANAVAGEEIRVAQGSYKPDQDEGGNVTPGDREATFQLINGVSLMGGFAGIGAPNPDDHDIDLFETILSGDLAGDDGPPGSFTNNAENCRNVVTGSATDPSAVLDGFTLTGGNADGPDDPAMLHLARGAGMWNDTGSPIVRDCRLEYNFALGKGGGMYNFDGSNPEVTGCTFRGNVVAAGLTFGGGMRNFQSSPTVIDCLFVANSAGCGGGMENTLSSPRVTDCLFIGNSAGRGGAVANLFSGAPIFTNCLFIGNSAINGGAMLNAGNNSPTVTNCTFTGNTAGETGSGGGMANFASSPSVTNCTFSGNTADRGGGMFNGSFSTPTVSNCTFSGNTATTDGGGMHNFDSTATVTDCIFSGNGAGLFAGGLLNGIGGFVIVERCAFTGNLAQIGGGMVNSGMVSVLIADCTFSANHVSGNGKGGGMHNQADGPLTIVNCLFRDNSAADLGGAINNFIGSTTILNCTFSGNSAQFGGGGISGGEIVNNCILWGNTPDQFEPTFTGTITFSDVQGGWPGAGNIDADPLFVDPLNGDYRLSPGSPCIDAGDNTAVSLEITTDLDGNPRFVDDPATPDTGNGDPPIVDMGAYEFQFQDSDGDGIQDDEDACPESVLTATIIIDGCDSGVQNMLFEDGCTMADLIAECAEGAVNHGQFVRCVAHLTNEWKRAGLINGREKGRIQSCAARSNIPGDLDGDGAVGVADLVMLLGEWGPCPAHPDACPADVDLDDIVGISDLLILLGNWG